MHRSNWTFSEEFVHVCLSSEIKGLVWSCPARRCKFDDDDEDEDEDEDEDDEDEDDEDDEDEDEDVNAIVSGRSSSARMNVFLRLGFSFLLLFCAPVSTQGPECAAGCHGQHGFCESGECRCRSGWRGPACDQCVPPVGCAHGTCEEPGQCVCERGWTGARCDRDVGPCSSQRCSGSSSCVETEGDGGRACRCSAGDGSRCQNGGSCSASRCLCPAGFTGVFCEIQLDGCEPNPCLNGGRCVSGIRCSCLPRFTGPSCELHVKKLKLKPRVKAQHFSAPALHKLLRPVPVSTPLVTRSQILCFSVLALLTCLVVLVTTGLIFFPRCEVWVANRRYRRLVQENQRKLLQHPPVNTILPEKIRLSAYGPHYTSI